MQRRWRQRVWWCRWRDCAVVGGVGVGCAGFGALFALLCVCDQTVELVEGEYDEAVCKKYIKLSL